MKLFNSLSSSIEEFTPNYSEKVSLYVCGITPYDTTHLGHAFTYIGFDVLIRYLRYLGYQVKYTQNVTDINDRDNDILQRAKEQDLTWQKLADFWTKKFLTDMQSLNWVKPDNYLKASENIPSMIDLIQKLLLKDLAYEKNGSIYLDISKFPNYGKLSGLNTLEMLDIAEKFEEDLTNPDKKKPLDITLWRATVVDQPLHIPTFNSPFSPGRPGWHIECSAMAVSSLGEQIDIHGGGKDLIYPHHEDEIIQSEGATGKSPFAKFWLHTGTVYINGAKMSKSDKNLVMVSDLLKKYSANSIRWLLLSHHWANDWEFSESDLIQAQKNINQVINLIKKSKSADKHVMNQFNQLLSNNLNTPEALELLLKSPNKQIFQILGFTL